MTIQIQGTNSVNVLADTYLGGLRTCTVPRGEGYSLATVTGTVGAVLGINNCIFAMRLNPATTKVAYFTQFRLQWCVTTAFTAPGSSGRRLSLYRGYGAAASTGTALATAAAERSAAATSQFNSGNGGDMRVVANVTTTGLTTTGITFETQELETCLVAGMGAASTVWTFERRWDAAASTPIQIRAGQVLALRNPVAMDAAGVFVAGIDLEWFEL